MSRVGLLNATVLSSDATVLTTRPVAQRPPLQQQQKWVPIKQHQQKELISGLIVTGLTNLGVSAFAAKVLGFIATTAITMGLNALLAPEPPRPADGKAPLTQEIPYCIWAVGKTRLSGAYMLWEERKQSLWGVQALTAHPGNAITKYYLHDDVVTLDGSDWVEPLDDGRYGDSADRVKIEHRLGAVPETAYSDIVSAFAGTDLYDADYRGDGQTSIGWQARDSDPENQQKHFPYGPPRVSVEGEWAKVFDPRDEAQEYDDPDTWTWSDNPVLILLWHQCFNEFGEKKDYTKAILPVVDLWKEEADVCDEPIDLKERTEETDGYVVAPGSTEKRYTCHYWDTTANDPKIGTNAILASFDGWICERGDGALIVVAGKFREGYVGLLTDADIAGVSIEYDVIPGDEINRLIPRFVFPETDYTEADTDFFEDSSAQLVAGRVLATEAKYPSVTSWTQARRLGKRDWLRVRETQRGTLDVRLSGINAVYRRWVKIQSSFYLPELDDAIVEFRQVLLGLTKGGYQAQFVRLPVPETLDGWDETTEEGERPPVPPKPDLSESGETLDAPVLVTAALVPTDRGFYARLVLEEPDLEAYGVVIKYRRDEGGGDWSAWYQTAIEDVTPSGGEVTVNTGVLPLGADVEVTAAWRLSGGTTGAFFDPAAALEPVLSNDPPSSASSLSADVSTPGQVTISWTAPGEDFYAGSYVYYNSVGNSFTTATRVNPPSYGAPSAGDSKTIPLPPGTHYGFVETFSTAGAVGTAVGTGAFTVT